MEILNINFQPLGDSGVRIQFYEQVSPELNRTIRSFCRELKKKKIKGIIEYVPAYNSVAIYYSPEQHTYHGICEKLSFILHGDIQEETEERSIVFIPTLYGGEAGPDLKNVARYNQITKQEVIDIHASTDYLIYMLGFLPGFPYMGGLSESITTPRLENPRAEVPKGSVAIAGEQTVIYSLKSPGGANLIGRTPVKLFDLSREEAFLFQSGDMVQFVPVSESEYKSIENEVENHTYKVKKEVLGFEKKYN